MSSEIFHIYEHVLPTSHIREYARATANDQEEVLNLCIKQYVPKQAPEAESLSVTIIAAHANGIVKELYEPFWEDLAGRLKRDGIHINGIWIADQAHQGASSVLNEQKLGNDPGWFDHSRDLFLMINHFRKYMKRPLVGIGHSMGGTQLLNLSLMHPRLFTTLVLLDPVVQRYNADRTYYSPAVLSTKRRDIWPSRRAAEASMSRSKFYQSWDPRAFKRWIQYGLRDLPTHIYKQDASKSSKEEGPQVTLTTTKHQEVFTFVRPNFPTSEFPNPSVESNPLTAPDLDLSLSPGTPFYRPEAIKIFANLPFLRPSVLYVFGDPKLSDLSWEVLVADRLAQTGIGVGGSGGFVKGRVTSVAFEGVGHMVPLEAPGKCADAATTWFTSELRRFHGLEAHETQQWLAVPKDKRSQMSEEFVKAVKSISSNQPDGQRNTEPKL